MLILKKFQMICVLHALESLVFILSQFENSLNFISHFMCSPSPVSHLPHHSIRIVLVGKVISDIYVARSISCFGGGVVNLLSSTCLTVSSWRHFFSLDFSDSSFFRIFSILWDHFSVSFWFIFLCMFNLYILVLLNI